VRRIERDDGRAIAACGPASTTDDHVPPPNGTHASPRVADVEHA
jgi:hypothetical protein